MEVERALVVTAHPDDVDFGAGGTIAQWTDAGTEVTYCIVTDGDAGGFDPDVPRSDIGGIRREEQRAAAKVLGVSDVRFLGYPDGRLAVSFELRRDLSRVIREVRPQRLVCQSPERNMLRIPAAHPDHLAAGEAAMCALYPDARNPFAHSEIADLAPWTISEAWVMGSERNNRYVDVTDSFDRKITALHSHVSQMSMEEGAFIQMMRGWNGSNARAAGLPADRLAEAFWVMQTG